MKFNAMNFLTVGTAAMAGQIWAGELWGGVGAAAFASGGLYMFNRVKNGTSCSTDSCTSDSRDTDNAHEHSHEHDHSHEGSCSHTVHNEDHSHTHDHSEDTTPPTSHQIDDVDTTPDIKACTHHHGEEQVKHEHSAHDRGPQNHIDVDTHASAHENSNDHENTHAHDDDHTHDHEHTHGGLVCMHDHGPAHDHDTQQNAVERYLDRKIPRIYSLGKAALSLGALMGVSHFTVKNAVLMTDTINMSPAQLGVVIAAGAALSEGYLSIRAALKQQSSFAFGNVMGCNITNTMLIGGGIGAASLGINGLDGLGSVLGIEQISEWVSQNAAHLKNVTIPESLNPRTLSGAFHTGVFVGAPALAAAMMASNKGRISKRQGEVLAGAFALYLAGSAILGSPCHQHVFGDIVTQHCSSNEAVPIEAVPTLEFGDELDLN